MKKYAVIVAGGSGSRMRQNLPKQFLEVHGKPILMHTLELFAAVGEVEIVLVLPASQFDFWDSLKKQHHFTLPHQVVAGGTERTDSVRNGLACVPDDSLVAIHDGVRPLTPRAVIVSAYAAAASFGSGVAAVALKDSIREVSEASSMAKDRSRYRLVQTPQTFQAQLIKSAYQQAGTGAFTDDASVFEAAGHTVRLVEGDFRNIKITTPEDLEVATIWLSGR